MGWAIAVSVRGIEIVQAIIVMQYWAPVRTSYSRDPCWLQLCHATQLAREIGIDDPARADRLVAAPMLAGVNVSAREQLLRRNHERTWLCVFIADQTFGSVTGRRKCVSWNEVPPDAFEWWKKPGARDTDRVISGLVETSGLLLDAVEERKGGAPGSAAVASWHSKWFQMMEHVRKVRCQPDASPSSRLLPLLAVCLDHGTVVLNSQATRGSDRDG